MAAGGPNGGVHEDFAGRGACLAALVVALVAAGQPSGALPPAVLLGRLVTALHLNIMPAARDGFMHLSRKE